MSEEENQVSKEQGITCPKCQSFNKPGRNVCWNCGVNLKDPTIIQSQAIPIQPKPNPAPKSTSDRNTSFKALKNVRTLTFQQEYPTLKSISNLCQTIAGGFVVLAIVIGIAGLIRLFSDGSFLLGLSIIIGAIVFGLSGYIIYSLIAEGINVILDIELNTRKTATYSQKLYEQEQNQEE